MLRRGCAVLALMAGAACADEPPALTIGEVSFSENELLGLSEARRTELATISAFGLATANGRTLEVLAPLLEESLDDALLTHIAAELVLREGEVDGGPIEVREYVDRVESDLSLNVVRRLIDPNMGRSPSSASRRELTWQDEFAIFNFCRLGFCE